MSVDGAMVVEVFERPADFMNREIEVASVDMTMPEIAAAFAEFWEKPSTTNRFRLKPSRRVQGRASNARQQGTSLT